MHFIVNLSLFCTEPTNGDLNSSLNSFLSSGHAVGPVPVFCLYTCISLDSVKHTFQSNPYMPFTPASLELQPSLRAAVNESQLRLFLTGSPRGECHRAQLVPEGHDLPSSSSTKPPPSLICLSLDDYLCCCVTNERKRALPAR